MTAIGMGLLWGGYAVGLWGYCLVRGYNIGFIELINPVHPFIWPGKPPLAGNTVIFPNGAAASSATATLTAAPGPTTTTTGMARGGGGPLLGGTGMARSGGGPLLGKTGGAAWSRAFLAAAGLPQTAANIKSVNAWQAREGGGGRNNPLNTTLRFAGSSSFNGVGVQNYLSAADGVRANAQTLLGGGYGDLIAALRSGQGLCGRSFAGFSRWSGGGYSSVC